MKQYITIFLCFLLTASIILPSVSQTCMDGAVELVDLLDDEEKKESSSEKEIKDVFVNYTRDLAFVDIQEKQSLLAFHKLYRYDAHIDISVPPPQELL